MESFNCPKCGTKAAYLAESRSVWNPAKVNRILVCRTCGFREYDETRIQALENSAQKCSWAPCNKKRTPTSIYCSRTCRERNAMARYKARQKAKAR